MLRIGALFRISLLLLAASCATAQSSETDPDDEGDLDGMRDGSAGDAQDGSPTDAGGDAKADGGGSDAASCLGVVCTSPPGNECEGANAVRIYEAEGSCVAGACDYPSSKVDCPFGCSKGACEANPCEGVVCNEPPSNKCIDATTIRVYSAQGTCGKGGCQYPSELKTCAHGCAQGACKDDPCANVTCNAPPPNECASASYLKSHSPTGTCNGGQCSYLVDNILCEFGCKDGVCNGDPCLGKNCATPPANYCETSSKLVVYDAGGTCNQGVCSYVKHTEFCAYGCDSDVGKCKANPCLGVKCEQPNANYCLDEGTLRQFKPQGTCSTVTGVCSYEYDDIECPCAQGVCKDCVSDDDCEAGKFCYDFSCRPCTIDGACGESCTDCTASGNVCNKDSGSCVQCVVNGHCGPGSRCEDGACSVCQSDDACGTSCAPCGGATPFCLGQGAAGQCVECRSDADCSDGRTCNTTTHTCGVSPLCQAALTSAATSLANSATWKHAKMDGVGTGWNWDYWQYGKATSGPGACHEGTNCWATNLTGNYINCQRADLRTPAMNVSACADAEIKLVFWHWYDFWTGQYPSGGTNRYDGGLIELSGNNGTTWSAVAASDVNYSGTTNINPSMSGGYACTSGSNFYVHNKPGYVGQSGGWQRVEVTIPKELRTSQLMVRFAYASGVSKATTSQTPTSTYVRPGWYLDGVAITAP